MTTQTRIPQGSPWRQTPRWLGISAWAVAIIAIAGAVLALVAVTAGVVSFAPARVADAGVQMRPEAPAVPQQPVAVTAPAPAPAPQAPVPAVSQDNGATAPKPVAWPLVKVTWTPVTDLSILPPAEQGFYNGTMQNAPDGATATHELGVYAAQIVSGRYEFTDHDLYSAVAAISRDPSNKQIVLVGLGLAHGPILDIKSQKIIKDVTVDDRLFLSTDGEKTWREIKLFPPVLEGGVLTPWETRVTSQSDGSILLFVRGGGGGDGKWREAILTP